MTRCTILPVILTISFIVGHAWAQTPTAGDITVDAPAYKIGDQWTYPGNVVTVVGIDGEYVVKTSTSSRDCPGCRFFRDRNDVLVKVHDADGKPVSDYPISGLKMLDFPMRVGKEWQHETRLRQLSTGAFRPYMNYFKVEAYEDVKTRAGVFKAFRISYRQVSTGPGETWRGDSTLWWAPQVKMFVTRAVHTSGWGTDWELSSYTLK